MVLKLNKKVKKLIRIIIYLFFVLLFTYKRIAHIYEWLTEVVEHFKQTNENYVKDKINDEYEKLFLFKHRINVQVHLVLQLLDDVPISSIFICDSN